MDREFGDRVYISSMFYIEQPLLLHLRPAERKFIDIRYVEKAVQATIA